MLNVRTWSMVGTSDQHERRDRDHAGAHEHDRGRVAPPPAGSPAQRLDHRHQREREQRRDRGERQRARNRAHEPDRHRQDRERDRDRDRRARIDVDARGRAVPARCRGSGSGLGRGSVGIGRHVVIVRAMTDVSGESPVNGSSARLSDVLVSVRSALAVHVVARAHGVDARDRASLRARHRVGAHRRRDRGARVSRPWSSARWLPRVSWS